MHERVPPVTGSGAQDLVTDRRDDRDQHDPAADHDEGTLPADEREGDDGQGDDDDEKFRAAALVGGRVLADLVGGQRIARLERVDRHVLGAVVLEDTPDVRRERDQDQVAHEQPHAY